MKKFIKTLVLMAIFAISNRATATEHPVVKNTYVKVNGKSVKANYKTPQIIIDEQKRCGQDPWLGDVAATGNSWLEYYGINNLTITVDILPKLWKYVHEGPMFFSPGTRQIKCVTDDNLLAFMKEDRGNYWNEHGAYIVPHEFRSEIPIEDTLWLWSQICGNTIWPKVSTQQSAPQTTESADNGDSSGEPYDDTRVQHAASTSGDATATAKATATVNVDGEQDAPATYVINNYYQQQQQQQYSQQQYVPQGYPTATQYCPSNYGGGFGFSASIGFSTGYSSYGGGYGGGYQNQCCGPIYPMSTPSQSTSSVYIDNSDNSVNYYDYSDNSYHDNSTHDNSTHSFNWWENHYSVTNTTTNNTTTTTTTNPTTGTTHYPYWGTGSVTNPGSTGNPPTAENGPGMNGGFPTGGNPTVNPGTNPGIDPNDPFDTPNIVFGPGKNVAPKTDVPSGMNAVNSRTRSPIPTTSPTAFQQSTMPAADVSRTQVQSKPRTQVVIPNGNVERQLTDMSRGQNVNNQTNVNQLVSSRTQIDPHLQDISRTQPINQVSNRPNANVGNPLNNTVLVNSNPQFKNVGRDMQQKQLYAENARPQNLNSNQNMNSNSRPNTNTNQNVATPTNRQPNNNQFVSKQIPQNYNQQPVSRPAMSRPAPSNSMMHSAPMNHGGGNNVSRVAGGRGHR